MLITLSRGLYKRLSLSFVSVVSGRILEQLKASPSFALMVDSTTDVAVVKEVIIYAYILHGPEKKSVNLFHCNEIGCGWSCRHHYGGFEKIM